jgi:inosine-uridine nucleoside N-ribohydrolase
MQYRGTASPSEGADLIIGRARAGSVDDPLWVVGLGAATNLAAALILAPDIIPLVRFVFHARNEFNWPSHTTQFNVVGDVIAVQTLLESDVPLVWFDTGTALTLSMKDSEERLASLGELGRYLHDFRHRSEYFARSDKGFFDLGDIAWLIEPGLCREETIPAPKLERHCRFDSETPRGEMRRVFNIDPEPTWDLFFDRMAHFADPSRPGR